jgi:hypothetical protein
MTAFQVAANDEIRQLFIRPNGASNRFCNDNDTNNKQQLLTIIRGSEQNANDDSDDDDDDDAPLRGWVDAITDEKSIEGTQITIAVGKSLFGFRFARSVTFAALNHLSNEPFSSYENEKSVKDFLQRLVDEHVTPHHPCDTAIQLYAISDKLPCLSDFENEREVLLLPNTLFYVKRIDNNGDQQYTTIWLEHVPPEKHPVRALLQSMAKDIRKE